MKFNRSEYKAKNMFLIYIFYIRNYIAKVTPHSKKFARFLNFKRNSIHGMKGDRIIYFFRWISLKIT